MLVLTRKYGQKIMIGDDIVITVLEARGDAIRVGIEAPAGVSVKRAEVYEAVSAENIAALNALNMGVGTSNSLQKALGLLNGIQSSRERQVIPDGSSAASKGEGALTSIPATEGE